MTSLIQNYANNVGQTINSINDSTKKYYQNLTDTNSENLLKPLDGKGHLVEGNLLTQPKEFLHDTYYTAKSLSDGITGKANDHELGKLNDLGLKIGGLGIAAYLMTKASTTRTKAMEFVGFGTFLASMAIWPKVALQWPARIVHGFNFRKQYVDEQGRKKYVTQDPNYIPFDLYKGNKKSEDLSVIGDRMHIAKDEKDRNEIVKAQMRKISVQNNTLWMLTAGIASPVMTGLGCNLLEKPIAKFAEAHDNKKYNKLADDVNALLNPAKDADAGHQQKLENKLINSNIDKDSEKSLKSILTAKKGQAINANDIDSIADILSTGFPEDMKKAAKTDLEGMLSGGKGTLVDNTLADNITETFTKNLDNQYGEGFTSSLYDPKRLSEHIDNFMNANGKPADGVLNAQKSEELRKSVIGFINDSATAKTGMSPARKKMIGSKALNSVNEVFGAKKAVVLTEKAAAMIEKAGSHLNKYRALDKTISSISHFKVEEAPETIIANNWGEVSDTLVDALGITNKEIRVAKNSPELTAELFQTKLEALCQDEDKYKAAVKKVSNAMAKLDTKLDNPTAGKPGVMETVSDGITKNCSGTADNLKQITSEDGSQVFSNIANRLFVNENEGVTAGTLKDSKLRRINETRIGGVKNSYSRLLHTFDFFKRAEEYSKNPNGKFSGDPEMGKTIIAKGKKILLSSHSGDFFLKFDTANNSSIYKAIMWHVFNSGESSNSTKEALNTASHDLQAHRETTMGSRVGKWADKIRNVMGRDSYDFLPAHIQGEEGVDALTSALEKTPEAKFNSIASTPAGLLNKGLNQKYASNKWMKIFATVGGIVLAGTVASQFAFGKKDPSIKTSK